MRGIMGLAAVLSAFAASASAQELITSPDWAVMPSGETIARYYPMEAVDQTLSGRVAVLCNVGDKGYLTACKAVDERPAGMGFAQAAARMVQREFRIKPLSKDGKPTAGGVVRVSFVFLSGNSGGPYIILDPIWAQAPSFEDVAAAWPEEAGELEAGSAALRCRLSADGTLNGCKVAGVVPRNGPFGDAALTLTDRFRMRMTPEERDKFVRSDVMVSFQFLNPATPAGQARKVVKPAWISKIDPAKIVALYPQPAADKGVTSGVGVADCLVAPDGKLIECEAAREDPSGLGFAASAVAVAGITQMNPWTPDGRPVAGARIKLPITFNLAPEPEAAGEAGQ